MPSTSSSASSAPTRKQRELKLRQRLKTDRAFYCEHALKVLTKKGGDPVPLKLNRIQREIDRRLDEQLARIGLVRALILKGRQVGVSTYVGGRYYHRATHSRGCHVFILTHEQEATDTLFGMVERFHLHVPALVRPSTSNESAKELLFDKLDSGYRVGTAGAKAKGRSKMVRLLHGSEVAFWPNAASHFAGVVQAVPFEPGTEVVLESTAHGMGDEFHQRWQQAERGEGDYIAIFVPWFWHEEYTRPVPPGFELDDSDPENLDSEYMEQHGLTLGQMVWRRAKIAELKDPLLFKQEYPATAAEAFQNTGHDSFIKPRDVMRARKAQLEGHGRLVLGVDPSRFGADRFSVAHRVGRKVLKVESKQGLDTVAGANWIKTLIDTLNPAKVFIDVGGIGAGVYDLLRDWGYSDRDSYDKNVVRSVDFGGAPQQTELLYSQIDNKPMAGPKNRRAEIWMRSRDWLQEPGGADIPDSDELHADACAPGYSYDTLNRLVLESKEHMMKIRKVRSPDEWDAVALTFAEPVPNDPAPRGNRPRGAGGGWQGQ